VALIVNGHVALWRTADDGRQLLVSIAGPGEFAATTGIARQRVLGDIVALRPGRMLVWSGEQVRDLALHDPALALAVLDDTIRWMAHVMTRVEALHSQSAQRRVASVLLAYEPAFFGTDPFVGTRELPGLVGTSREMTGRVLRKLEASGVLQRRPDGLIDLLDRPALQRLAAVVPEHTARPAE